MSSSLHQRNLSEPHSYNIQAKLQNGILSIYVHDTMTNFKWRQEFTQISFPGHKLYDVAKALIMAIQQMINDTQQQQHQLQPPSSTNHHNMDIKPIAILVYNQWCYLTIHGSNLPSFALRPIDESQPYGFTTNKQNKNIKFGDTNRDKRINHNIKFKKNQQNTNQHQQQNQNGFTNSAHLHLQNNHNKPSTNNTSSIVAYNKRKPVIIINKGVVARNIAKFSQQQTEKQSNAKKTSYASNSRKSSTKSHKKTKRNSNNKPKHSNNNTNNINHKHKDNKDNKNKNSNKAIKKKQPSRPPPTLNAASVANENHHCSLSPPTPKNNRNSSTFLPIGQRPPTPTPTPLRLSASTHNPLPFLPSSTHLSKPMLPSLPIAQKMTVRNINNNNNRHNNSQSLHQFGDNLSPLIRPRHSASASNHLSFAQMFNSSYNQNISIPAPPVPRKLVNSPKKSVSATNTGINPSDANIYSQSMYHHSHHMHHQKGISRELEPGQVMHLQPGQNQNGNGNVGNTPHLDLHSSSGDGSDYDDGIMVNTDDEDSSSYKPAMSSGHSNHSNTGSLDSLFTTHAGKMTDGANIDDDDDDDNDNVDCDDDSSDSKELETAMSSDEASETEDDEDAFSSDDMFECDFSGKEDGTPRGPKEFHREYEEVVDCGIIKRSNYEEEGVKGRGKGKKKRSKSKWKLTICVNGDKIQDMFSHVIEQQIAEEEYYEEEDAMDEPFYDPNYLGINPYYDD